MGIHELHLQKKYYDFIESGTKRVELRLYDEKRAKIRVGDEILFSASGANSKIVRAEVVGLLLYGSFGDLVEDYPIEILADAKMTKEELLKDLNQFYAADMQKKFGVVGIRFKINDSNLKNDNKSGIGV